MLESKVVYTRAADVETAARELCAGLSEAFGSQPCDVIILFASPRYDHSALLASIASRYEPKLLTGASSAGEFTSEMRGEGLACALGLRADDMAFALSVGRGISKDRVAVAKELAGSFEGRELRDSPDRWPYRSALVLTDALAGHADELVEQLTLATSGAYQFFGGGAGDDAQFRRTHVFYGTQTLTDAAVALEILSRKPVGIGMGHGWRPASAAMRVTQAEGAQLVSLNGLPAVDAFEAHAEATGQRFSRTDPLPFFLHNIVGIDTGNGHRLRVPLRVLEDGAVVCAAEIPNGAKVHIMGTDERSAIEAASRATKVAMKALGDHKPKTALFFDCVATRLRLGSAFDSELGAVTDALGPLASYIGCNTHGQIARAEGQFGGFHNCTAVVCILPE